MIKLVYTSNDIIIQFFSFLVVLETDVEIIQESEDLHETSFTSTQMFDTDELLLRLPSRKLSKMILFKIFQNIKFNHECLIHLPTFSI